jgi:hypothetical protein
MPDPTDKPAIAAVETISTGAETERVGQHDLWVRVHLNETSVLLHPDEALLFAQQIRVAVLRARGRDDA